MDKKKRKSWNIEISPKTHPNLSKQDHSRETRGDNVGWPTSRKECNLILLVCLA